MECSSACRGRWLSTAQAIQSCKSFQASSLAAWIASRSSRIGGRKTRRGVTIGIKWRIERLNCNGSCPPQESPAAPALERRRTNVEPETDRVLKPQVQRELQEP